eukprot:TRINITY_DN1603_c0_g1_i5.p1 TRINITY_DN1603_c0_g1~~TRINITY_DN1603_c0_g1_i5.p1  ORF type:complete len:175 (+),score=30.76 TRINITY_DN1603_c0_g1_i5:62-586(+)
MKGTTQQQVLVTPSKHTLARAAPALKYPAKKTIEKKPAPNTDKISLCHPTPMISPVQRSTVVSSNKKIQLKSSASKKQSSPAECSSGGFLLSHSAESTQNVVSPPPSPLQLIPAPQTVSPLQSTPAPQTVSPSSTTHQSPFTNLPKNVLAVIPITPRKRDTFDEDAWIDSMLSL